MKSSRVEQSHSVRKEVKVHLLKQNEVDQAAEVLKQAFLTDALMLWMFGSSMAYSKYSQTVFSTWVRYCLLYGVVYRTEDFSSVAILKKPGFTEFTLWGIIRSGMIFNIWSLGIGGWLRLLQYDTLSSENAQSNMASKDYWYLWMLGTKPDSQGQGLGTKILKNIDETLKTSTGMSCYLEATSASSASLYRHNGYAGLNFFTIPHSNIKIECMEKRVESGVLN